MGDISPLVHLDLYNMFISEGLVKGGMRRLRKVFLGGLTHRHHDNDDYDTKS